MASPADLGFQMKRKQKAADGVFQNSYILSLLIFVHDKIYINKDTNSTGHKIIRIIF
jgi:hypothetical protein